LNPYREKKLRGNFSDGRKKNTDFASGGIFVLKVAGNCMKTLRLTRGRRHGAGRKHGKAAGADFDARAGQVE
jgi:hypothetical protein